MAKEDGFADSGFEFDLHGDFRVPNLLVPGERFSEKYLLDFQLCKLGYLCPGLPNPDETCYGQ